MKEGLSHGDFGDGAGRLEMSDCQNMTVRLVPVTTLIMCAIKFNFEGKIYRLKQLVISDGPAIANDIVGWR